MNAHTRNSLFSPSREMFPTVSLRTTHQVTVPFPEETKVAAPIQAFVDFLLRQQLVLVDAFEVFQGKNYGILESFSEADQLGIALVEAGLLTPYQLDRIMAGTTHGLVLGNHRILDRLGAGGMGVVFRGEHIYMRRPVALKVLPVDDDCSSVQLERFYAEMRVLAELHHPHIVMAYDAGKVTPAAPGLPTLVYLAMELVDGCDLDYHVRREGPAPIHLACEWIRQAASGLQQAHDQNLIHRDIKPSNLLLRNQGQVKLSDFGLVRQFANRLTDPSAFLGTLEFMAPEQSQDPTNVGSAADIYGLGASLFWLLTGETPFPQGKAMSESLRLLQDSPPRKLRKFRPDAPKELEEVVDRLLHKDPTRRPALPMTVMNALQPFTRPPTCATRPVFPSKKS